MGDKKREGAEAILEIVILGEYQSNGDLVFLRRDVDLSSSLVK